MARTLTGGIIERFDASTLKSEFEASGGLWLGMPPPSASQKFPLIVLVNQGEVPEFSTESGYYETGHVRFEIYHQDLDQAETLGLKLMDLFDVCDGGSTQLNITRGSYNKLTRTRGTPDASMFTDKDDNIVYQVSIDYDTFLSGLVIGQAAA